MSRSQKKRYRHKHKSSSPDTAAASVCSNPAVSASIIDKFSLPSITRKVSVCVSSYYWQNRWPSVILQYFLTYLWL